MFRVSCTIWYQLRRGQRTEGRGWHKTFLATGTFLINLLQQFKQQTRRGGLGHIKIRETVRWEDAASENNRFWWQFFQKQYSICGELHIWFVMGWRLLCYDDIYCMVGGARVSLSGKLTFNVHITFYVPVKINVADGTFTVFFIVLHGEQ